MTRETMNRVFLGTTLALAAAGLIYYLNHPNEVDARLSNIKDKASDAMGKAKTKLGRRADDVRARMNR